MKLTANFTLDEFKCRCGCGTVDVDNAKWLAIKLQELRNKVGPVHILSATRCPDNNKACGGHPSSQHLSSLAVDLDWSRMEVPLWILVWILERLEWPGGIGVGERKIHIDLGPRRYWTYGS